MKKVFLSLFLILIGCAVSFAQKIQSVPCPIISIVSPIETIKAGETVIFTSNVINAEDVINAEQVTYNWSISYGTIIEGQGTSVIKIHTTVDIENIIVTVEVKGLPKECANTSSAQVKLIPFVCCKDPLQLEYGKIPFRKEKARLDVVAAEFRKNKNLTAYFIFYYSKKDGAQTLKKRVARVSNYLTQTHNIPKDKLKFISGTESSYRTTIWLSPIETGIVNN
jgi:hypothetical protein